MALTTCVLWLLGVEVLPSVHLADHDDDHTHTASGTIVHSAHADVLGDEHDHALQHELRVDHDHGSNDAQHDRDRRRGRHQRSDELAFDRALTGHAAAGIAHHAIALHQPDPPSQESIDTGRLEWLLATGVEREPQSSSVARPQARGPPRV